MYIVIIYAIIGMHALCICLMHALCISYTLCIYRYRIYTIHIYNSLGFSQQHRSVLGGGEGNGDNTVPVLYVIKGVCVLAYVYLA